MENNTENMKEQLERGRLFIKRLEFLQYQFFNGRPVWTTIELNDLKLYMAYNYFGSPFEALENGEETNKDDENSDSIFGYYKKEVQMSILNMVKVIKKNFTDSTPTMSQNIEVGFTLTHSICKNECDICQKFPEQDVHQWYLLRIKYGSNKVGYIDLNHERTYENWEDYIENNTLPKGYIFYPESGYYEEANFLFKNLTPLLRAQEKVITKVDLVGKIANCVSAIVLGCGMIFPIMTPVLIPSSIASGSLSAYDAGRQICKLTDMVRHNQSLISKEAIGCWQDLAISALGVITAPLNSVTKTLELGNSTIMATKLGKSLSIIQKSACITQFSLEVFRLAAIVIDKKTKLSWTNLIELRLDLFVVVGTLFPIIYIQQILEFIGVAISTTPLYEQVLNIPYCLGRYIYNAACFIMKHVSVFTEQIIKFLKDNLTLDKCLLAYKDFCWYINEYKKLTKEFSDDDLLEHIVNDIIKWSGEQPYEVNSVLRGPDMKQLLSKIGGSKNRTMIRFCIDRVLVRANVLRSVYDENLCKCMEYNEMDVPKINRTFCIEYSLNDCCMSEYVRYGIRETVSDIQGFLREYEEYLSKPENQFEEELLAIHSSSGSSGSAPQSVKTYSFVAPPGNGLDQQSCTEFARTLDSQNHEYSNYKFVQTDPNVSILYSMTCFSVKIVLFRVDRFDGIDSMNIAFFRDVQGSINMRLPGTDSPCLPQLKKKKT